MGRGSQIALMFLPTKFSPAKMVLFNFKGANPLTRSSVGPQQETNPSKPVSYLSTN